VHFVFRSEAEDVVVEVRPDGADWRLQIDGRDAPLQAMCESDGTWVVETHQGRRRLRVAVRGDERLVFCDGKVHTLRLPDPEHADEDVGPQGGPRLKADMPGKVVQILVSVDQTVTAGQPLLIMESMKMETELTAAVDGTVAAVHVGDGQVVGQGDALVDIAPTDGPADKEQR
jgi:biotin carboxyl carrier protein